MARTLTLVACSLLLLPAHAQDARPETEGELKIVSYNVWGIPSFITGRDTPSRQKAISPLLEPFDVVGVQEDFMDDGHALLMTRVTHPTRSRFHDILSGRMYGSGLTLLARPRAVKTHSEHYRVANGVLTNGSDEMASKGFQMARLELAPGVEVDFYNSHMDASGGAEDQAARASQVAHITSAMQTISRDRAVVFLGDTNLSGNEKRRARDVRTLRRWLKTTGLSCACAASRDSCCARIDRVLVRSGAGIDLSVRSWGVAPGFVDERGRALSDHQPIQAVLRWRRRAF